MRSCLVSGLAFATLLDGIGLQSMTGAMRYIASASGGDARCDLVPIFTGAAVHNWKQTPPALLAMLGIVDACLTLPVNDYRSYLVLGLPLGVPELGQGEPLRLRLCVFRARTQFACTHGHVA